MQTIEIKNIVAISNIEKLKISIDTVILDVINDEEVIIEGEYVGIENYYIVIGSTLAKILSCSLEDKNTRINIIKDIMDVKGDYDVGDNVRAVCLPDITHNDIHLLSWEFEDTMGRPNNTLFPVELSSGNVSFISDLSYWTSLSIKQKYRVRNRKTIVYLFKGDNINGLSLKFTTVVSKLRFNTRGKKEPNKIIFDIKSILAKWYDKDIVINKQLKGTTPKDFFKMLFNLEDNRVYYATGVKEDSFPKINNLHTKEYSTISELLKAYCQNGIRFCFDNKERIKIFGDFNVDNLSTEKILDYSITDSMLTEDELMIYNTINTQSYQRQTLYNFEDLDRKFVKFFKKLENAVDSSKFIRIQENGDYTTASIEIVNEDFHKSVQLKDYVLFKRTVEPRYEYYGRVISIESDNKVIVVPILYDKDFKLFNYGKNKYLYNILVLQSCQMDLYYVREELPMIFKLTRNKDGEEADSNLFMPILPKVDGEVKFQEEINATFGSASNLKIGSYTGITEEIDGIYGTWDSSKLLYNMELEQFSNTSYPPIFALTNKLKERLVKENVWQIEYTHFDNSDFMLQVERPSDNSCDAVLKISSNVNVNSNIDLFVGKEIGRIGNKILQVENADNYSLGDVLIVNKPDNLTQQEETEFDETLSNIKWVIMAKEKQYNEETQETKHYIYVNSNFAKRQKQGEVYEFTKYPNTSIIYLQELYFRGNPVIEFAQDIVGMSKGVSFDGDTSKDLYGEKKYELDSKQLNKDNLRLLMGYILDNFQATSIETTKYTVPISVFNELDINMLDIVRVNDPIYTQIKDSMKWVVTSVSCKSSTNEIQLNLLNINSKNTVPYKIDIKDVIEYKPVEVPTYDHAGGEGNTEDNNDGTGGTQEDKSLGKFWLSEVPSEKFRAKVEKFEGNYIYFKDFSGEEYEQYQSKLFPVSEFGVTIKGETIFVQSDMNYRAFIKKRRVYDTEEVLITPEDDVSFLVLTTYVDYDGTLYGRKAMFGDGDSYLEVDPITGVKIVGDFVVGENNKHDGNDLWVSMQNNRTFQQPEQPTDTPLYKLKEGDIWYDTNDDNHVYRYNGKVWISARDGSILSDMNSVFIQPSEPVPSMGRPIREGDSWYDSDDGNKPYRFVNGKWVNVADKGLENLINEANDKANQSIEKVEEMSQDDKLTPSEKIKVSQDVSEIRAEYNILVNEANKFGVSVVNYTNSYNNLMQYIIPLLSNMSETSNIVRSLFESTFINYYEKRQMLMNDINDLIKGTADKAQSDATTALGNSKIFYQTTPPKQGMKENDLWYDTDDNNHPYVYKDGEWTSARDMVYTTATGNKVYFQDTQPSLDNPDNKDGDMWFDTAHNNTLYVLKKNGSRWEWLLGSDANDKIETGRIVLNGNTTINGDFRVRGNNIELTGDTKITGALSVFGSDKGIVSYNGVDEASSTKRIMILGGEIIFQERVN